MMKKERAITLIALVITIIILLILAGVSIATLTGENGLLSKANTAKQQTEEKSTKEKIELAIISSLDKDGSLNVEDFEKEIEILGGMVTEKTEETITVEMDGYEAVIDIKTEKIIKFEPIKGVKTELDIKQELKGTTVTITVEIINEVEKVDSITITNGDTGALLGGNVNGKKGTFDTTLNGFYRVEVKATTEGVQKTTIQIIEINQIPVEFSKAYGRIEVVWLDTNDNIIPEPNKPNLGDMTRVKWNETTEVELQNDDGWYEYKAKEGKEDNLESCWANAKNGGSYFVWIPRYAYRITYYASETSNQITGYCDAKGMRAVNGEVQQKISDFSKSVEANGKSYIVHPAFRNGADNNFKNGEWDSELSGIWVAKYESCRNDATAKAEGSGSNIKIVPNVISWSSIKVGDCYTRAYNYQRSKESHLMKNSEWGAVAYLTQSQYGRNGHFIDKAGRTYLTGAGGVKASTTGNMYGIYDLSGGRAEFMAGYISNGSSKIAYYGSSFAKSTANVEGWKTLSTKYATIYPFESSKDYYSNNYLSYEKAGYGYGDAILEISATSNTFEAWGKGNSVYPFKEKPFFSRSAAHNNGDSGDGLFTFDNCYSWDNHYNGSYWISNSIGFRVVLAF